MRAAVKTCRTLVINSNGSPDHTTTLALLPGSRVPCVSCTPRARAGAFVTAWGAASQSIPTGRRGPPPGFLPALNAQDHVELLGNAESSADVAGPRSPDDEGPLVRQHGCERLQVEPRGRQRSRRALLVRVLVLGVEPCVREGLPQS
jgi:hypothetical protein